MKTKKRRKIKRFFAVLLLVAVTTTGFVFAEKRVSDIVKRMSEQSVKANASLIISRVVFEELEKSGVTYDKLIHLEKDGDGKIAALETNIIEVNRLKSILSVRILEQLNSDSNMSIKIPIGTIFGGQIASGRGPAIKVKFIPIGTVATDINNVITSSGINQTRHQVELCVNVHIAIISALRNTSANVTTNVCIAETVIVGEVPESYTEIDAHSSEGLAEEFTLDPDDIFNFVY